MLNTNQNENLLSVTFRIEQVPTNYNTQYQKYQKKIRQSKNDQIPDENINIDIRSQLCVINLEKSCVAEVLIRSRVLFALHLHHSRHFNVTYFS